MLISPTVSTATCRGELALCLLVKMCSSFQGNLGGLAEWRFLLPPATSLPSHMDLLWHVLSLFVSSYILGPTSLSMIFWERENNFSDGIHNQKDLFNIEKEIFGALT